MKIFKFTVALIALLAWIYFLDRPFVTKKSTIPALAPFLSPFSGFWHNALLKDVIPGNVSSSVIGECTVDWDTRLVPHIFAANDRDLIYVSGYTVASQRLWQMDMLARSAVGRLAEVIGGEQLIARDKDQRRKGMLFAAENAVLGWQKDSAKFQLIEAYTKGVNDWIKHLKPKDYPIEYKIMGFAPEYWSPLKTAAIVKYMAQSLCSREFDLEASNTLELLGDSLFNFMFPASFELQSPIIPTGTKWGFDSKSNKNVEQIKLTDLNNIYRRASELPDPGLGSNNWAVSGSKTKSGRPILCNDPHLRLTLPSIWFENHLHTPEFNAYGVSVPGIPGILIGFNDDIAWGETNVGHDVADWYRISWTDSTRSAYILDGNTIKVYKRIEEIKIKNKATQFDTVTYTAWGPVVKDVLDDPHTGMAYHWLAHEIPQDFEMSVFLNLMRAKNYEDYYQALRNYSNPAQNFIFASKNGDIAITVTGKLPVKESKQGLFVQDGASSRNAWNGYIPYEHLPRVKNPLRGFVSSANQHSTAPDYPYYYNGDFDHFRGRTINNELQKMSGITHIQMMDLQNNNRSLKAAENLPLMLSFLDSTVLNDSEKHFKTNLAGWNFNYDFSSKEALVFNTWYRWMFRSLLDELFSSKDSSYLMYPKSAITLDLLAKYPTHSLWDIVTTPTKETAKDIVFSSFKKAVSEVLALAPSNNHWGAFSKTKIQHIANLPGFSIDNVQIGGMSDVLNAVYNGSGPSWRMVVEFKDTTKAHVIYPGGQSGNPGSKYYDNMISDWAAGRYQMAVFGHARENFTSIYSQTFKK